MPKTARKKQKTKLIIMKKNLKTLLAVVTLMISMAAVNSATAQEIAKKKADKQTVEWRYEVQCVGVGNEGTKLIKVFSYSKKPTVAIEQSKKNAIHAMIFQGFNGNSGSGCPTQKPLTNNPALEQEKSEYFDQFFADGGKYMKFVSISGDGEVAAEDRMKVGKEYKIGVVVSVLYDLLRKDLEAAGIIKGLSSGF